MLQGTASSVGKSLLVTALCRILRQDGVDVAPFKAQNMSNNSFVSADGLELGRAQAVQAEAAGVEPTAEMNPILLKPEADQRSQVVVLGRPRGTIGGADFISRKAELWPAVTASLDLLRERHRAIIIEGAGSPAEINLRASDIVNMRVARYAQAPVLLVGDIDRGGVFAHLVGTLQLLEGDERRLVRGLIVNKFRGTRSLLQPGIAWLEEYTGIPVAGVVPWLNEVGVADEDAVALEAPAAAPGVGMLDVAVMQFPRIANFDDLDPLAAEPGVRVRFVSRAAQFGAPDLVVLPGTKATIADLDWLRDTGLAGAVCRHVAAGRMAIGICGGFQMLGGRIHDPTRVESSTGEAAGLGLLPVETTFEPVKATHRVRARVTGALASLNLPAGAELSGYEIHMGQTTTRAPAFRINQRSGADCDEPDGAANADGAVFGTYLHGLFDNDSFRGALVNRLFSRRGLPSAPATPAWSRQDAYDRLAAHVRASLDIALVRRLLDLS
ncbi:MAG: cobyric acid synthase [Dehalococcoidia bacterium]